MSYRLTLVERETIIIMNDEDKTATVSTWQRRIQRRLQANPEARLLKERTHKHPDDVWMQFEVPRELVSVRVRRVVSAEQREKVRKRLHPAKDGPASA